MRTLSMSMFASIADYNAALDADKSAVIAHYAAEEAKAAEEAQQAKDAARYRWLVANRGVISGDEFGFGVWIELEFDDYKAPERAFDAGVDRLMGK